MKIVLESSIALCVAFITMEAFSLNNAQALTRSDVINHELDCYSVSAGQSRNLKQMIWNDICSAEPSQPEPEARDDLINQALQQVSSQTEEESTDSVPSVVKESSQGLRKITVHVDASGKTTFYKETEKQIEDSSEVKEIEDKTVDAKADKADIEIEHGTMDKLDKLITNEQIEEPNAGLQETVPIQDRDTLEDRDLIEKYKKKTPYTPAPKEAIPIQNRDVLEDRDLIKKYNDLNEPNPANDHDVELPGRDVLEDRDLIKKYDKIKLNSTDNFPWPDFSRENKLTQLEIGTEVYRYQYREPNFMKLTGPTYGIYANYIHRFFENNHLDSWKQPFKHGNGINQIRIETRGSMGILDYASEGTGTNDNERHYTFEMRGLVGYDLPFENNLTLTPFLGFGYRYLLDDSGGEQTTTGHYTYDRESTYAYVPIGLEAVKNLRGQWAVGLTIEWDVMIDGVQKSHLEDYKSSYDTLSNDQNDGWGYRSSLKVMKKSDLVDLFLEPFYRYWHIGDSQVSTITYSGVAVGYGLEPENTTNEYGVKLGLRY